MYKFLLCLVCAGMVFAGCKKDDSGTTGPQTTATGAEDDAAEMIALALSAPGNGVVVHVAEAVQLAQYGVLQKSNVESSVAGTAFDTTVVRKDSTFFGTYDYTVHLWYQFSDVRNKLDLSYNGFGVVNLARLTSSDTAASVVAIQHITDPDTTYLVSSSSSRSGTTTFKARNITVNNQVNVALANVRISKSTYRLVGGTGTVAGVLRDNTGRVIMYSGTVTLTDMYQASVLVNGKRYVISLLTGMVSAG